MNTTSPSLLQRLRDGSADSDWERFVGLYYPFLQNIFHRSFRDADVDDLIQEVLLRWKVAVKDFDRERKGSLRNWLKVTSVNCIKELSRANKKWRNHGQIEMLMEELEDENSGLSKLWNQEHDREVTRHAMSVVRGEFNNRDWQAFERFTFENQSAQRVADELGMSKASVWQANSRIRARLREELEGIIEDI